MTRIRYILPLSVLAALLVGYFPEIDNTLAMSRIIALYPFFLAGWFMPKEKMARVLSLPLRKRFFVGIGAVFFAMIVALLAAKTCHYTREALLFFPYQHIIDIGGRTAIFVISILMITGVVLLCPRGGKYRCSHRQEKIHFRSIYCIDIFHWLLSRYFRKGQR